MSDAERKDFMPADEMIKPTKERQGVAVEQPPVNQSSKPAGSWRMKGFVLMTIIIALCFSIPLLDLMRFAAQSELYSHILLIPFVSLYLVFLKRRDLPVYSAPPRKLAALFFIAGAAVLLAYTFATNSAFKSNEDNYLAFTSFSFLLFFLACCCFFWGKETLRSLAFPIGFLVFIVPFPAILKHWIEVFLQYGSALATEGLLKLSGTPYYRRGLEFHLPGFSMHVAPECSGIHSSLVLLVTSLVASYFFLRTPWKRTVLALAIIPLALVRNGIRIFTIGLLCVHIGPEMIDSPFHRRGGPLFFILSLIPFFLLLIFLKKSERIGKKPDSQKTKV